MKLPGLGVRRLLTVVLTSAALLVPLGVQEAAAAGDTVLVSPGTYLEQVDFRSKDITVESTDGPATTIIDGNRAGTVVTIAAGRGQTPVLRGFTVRNGSEGGVVTLGGPALIDGNRITGNVGRFSFGIGAGLDGAVQILDNTITGNLSSSDGGGISRSGAAGR